MDSGEWREKNKAPHTPVMLQEVLEWLRIRPDGVYVDATLGAGGHSEAIAESLTSGRLISLDRDAQALQIAQERLKTFGSKVNCVLSPFSGIAEAVHELGIPMVDGVLADLGVSSMQLDQAERGFSFREAGPLSMRMGVSTESDELTADEIVKAMGKAETASRDKNVSGAADSGESRDGGTRAVSFSGPRHNEFRSEVRDFDVPLRRRPAGEGSVSRSGSARDAEDSDETCSAAQRRRRANESAVA